MVSTSQSPISEHVYALVSVLLNMKPITENRSPGDV